jgi:FMN reductase
MKIATILGSARNDGNNAKALAIFHDELKTMEDVELVDIRPGDMDLRIPNTGVSADKTALMEMLTSADGVLITTPEYHGSYSSLIKMTIENVGYPSGLKKKPVVLMGVAGGELGTIKSIEHLSSVLRHVGSLVLPRYVSIANGDDAFDAAGNLLDAKIEARIRGLANELVQFVANHVRQEITMEQTSRDKDM